MTQKFYETAAFLALQKEWYKKLKLDSFDDLEYHSFKTMPRNSCIPIRGLPTFPTDPTIFEAQEGYYETIIIYASNPMNFRSRNARKGKEQQIMIRRGQGHSCKEIAIILGLAVSAVTYASIKHMKIIFKK